MCRAGNRLDGEWKPGPYMCLSHQERATARHPDQSTACQAWERPLLQSPCRLPAHGHSASCGDIVLLKGGAPHLPSGLSLAVLT